MDRMTVRAQHGILMNPGWDFSIDPDDYDLVQKILARLAAYEDSGYDPREYARQLRSAAKTAEGWCAEFQKLVVERDALLGEIEGRCDLCIHYNNGNGGKVCEHCMEDQNWEWHGTGGE